MFVYVGCITPRPLDGAIQVFRFRGEDGGLEPVETVAMPNPAYLTVHGDMLYVISRGRGGINQDELRAYAINRATGRLTLTGAVRTPPDPAFVSVDKTGRCALVACTFGGAVASVPLSEDGRIAGDAKAIRHPGVALTDEGFRSLEPGRQGLWPDGAAFPHSIRPSPDNRFATAADMGLNRVMIYRLDPTAAELTPNDPAWAEGSPLERWGGRPKGKELYGVGYWEVPAGAGSRHQDYHPNGRWLYVVNEMGSSVTAYSYDPSAGTLTTFQTIGTLPSAFEGFSVTADIHVHPSGRFVYASNRGEDSVAAFSVDQDSGRLTFLGTTPSGGRGPRDIALTPDGTMLLAGNMVSGTIDPFRVDVATGKLTPTGAVTQALAPSCIDFLAD